MQNKKTSEYREIFPYAVSPFICFALIQSSVNDRQPPLSLFVVLHFLWVCQDLSIFHFDLSQSLPFDEVIV